MTTNIVTQAINEIAELVETADNALLKARIRLFDLKEIVELKEIDSDEMIEDISKIRTELEGMHYALVLGDFEAEDEVARRNQNEE